MAGMVSALTDDGPGQVYDGGIGVSRPGLEGRGRDEGAAVEDVLAALAAEGHDSGTGPRRGPWSVATWEDHRASTLPKRQ
jgi:hypothetical protein